MTGEEQRVETLYLEYKIIKNRPGLLGDLASILGLMQINIKTVTSIEDLYRGFLLEFKSPEIKERLLEAFNAVEELKITALRSPTLEDLLALKHGKKVSLRLQQGVYVFPRYELEILINFLSNYLQHKKDVLIGIKGGSRSGKTETAIAAAVHANKHWRLLSTTLLRKTTVMELPEKELKTDTVYIIDAITSFHRSPARHVRLIRKFLPKKFLRIIEHPEVAIQESNLQEEDFDIQVELRLGKEIQDEKNSDFKKYISSISSFE